MRRDPVLQALSRRFAVEMVRQMLAAAEAAFIHRMVWSESLGTVLCCTRGGISRPHA